MMIFLSGATFLFLSTCFTVVIPGLKAQGSMTASVVAEALLQALDAVPAFRHVFDATLSPEAYYYACLKEFKDVGVLDYRRLAKRLRQAVETTFPRLTSEQFRKAVMESMATFLESQGLLEQLNLEKFVTSYVSLLQKAVFEARGNRELLAKKGFAYTFEYYVSSCGLNADNAIELFEPLFDSFHVYAYCKNSKN